MLKNALYVLNCVHVMYGEEEINREGYLIGDNKDTFLKEKYWLVRWGGGDVYVPLISSRDYKTCPYLGS